MCFRVLTPSCTGLTSPGSLTPASAQSKRHLRKKKASWIYSQEEEEEESGQVHFALQQKHQKHSTILHVWPTMAYMCVGLDPLGVDPMYVI